MLDLWKSVKSALKLHQVRIDNCVFRLHYKFTVFLLLLFGVLLTSKQFFGDPIYCHSDLKDIRDMLETYCWITGTYTIRGTLNGKSGYHQLSGLGTGDEILSHKFYQWVCVLFFFQAFLFYLPHQLWKEWESGTLSLLIHNLSGPLTPPEWDDHSKRRLVEYVVNESGLRNSHTLYALRYAACEILNFVNVLAQIFLLDWFLSGQFLLYGIRIFGPRDPMDEVFPKRTKCKYHFYGVSGSISSRDALCVLPLNVVNEKLFLVLWFWLFVLALVSTVAMVYRGLLFAVPRARFYLLRGQCRSLSEKEASRIVESLTYGDYFVLYQIAKNVNPVIRREVLLGVRDALCVKNPYYGFEHRA